MSSLPRSVREKIRRVAGVHVSHFPEIRVQEGDKPPVHRWERHLVEVGADWICAQPEMAALILEYELRGAS